MRRILLLAALLYCPAVTLAGYWEDIPAAERGQVDESAGVHYSVRRLVNNARGMSDKEKYAAMELMAGLSDDPCIKAFYFHAFNEKCLAADGEQAEVMGKYCLRAVMADPAYVLEYLASHPELMDRYALFMGTEFYFKAGRLSDIAYDFEGFRKAAAQRVGCEMAQTLECFCCAVQRNMKNLQ